MTPRERVLEAFAFKRSGRPPLDIMENSIWDTLQTYFKDKYNMTDKEEILTHLGGDVRWLLAGTPQQLNLHEDDTDAVETGTYGGDVARVMADAETPEEVRANFPGKIEDVVFPDFAAARKKYPDHALVFCPVWMPIFSGACEVFGMEEAMINLVAAPELIEAYGQCQAEFAIKVFEEGIRRGAAEYCDFAWMGDDFSDNRGLMLSPEMWRQQIKPHLARIAGYIKSQGMRLLFHSCGSVESVIPDFIEMGVDGLLVVQTSAHNMNVELLAEKYAGKIVFWGAIDAQQLLTMGDEQQVAEEVAKNCRAFANGGYVVANSHHGLADIKGENIEAMCRAALAYGK